MWYVICIAVAVAGFLCGRAYERRRIKYIGKPLNTQDVLGVWKYDKTR